MATTIRGTIMQTPRGSGLDVQPHTVVTVDDAGVITSVVAADHHDGPVDVSLPASAVLLPGLIDTHVHAPQWPQLGAGLDLPLETWLFEITFPLEARYADAAFAAEVWAHMVPTLLAHGTTTAVYYGTVHGEATRLLAETCARIGQRAFVGRVGMDHPEGTPDWYRDQTAAAGVQASATSLQEIADLGSSLVAGIVTPRFIPACTDALLEGLAELAAATGALVQTHCSESDWEHQYVLDRMGRSDTVALRDLGLLGRSTVLAHADLVSADDLGVIRDHGAGIAHCPLSNIYFANAVFPARRALAAGVHVGLGSDVAGGAEPGLLRQCGYAVSASRSLEEGVDPDLAPGARGVADSRIDIVDAFRMATIGGADLLGLPVGLIEPGRRFDALVVDPAADAASPLRRWDVDDDIRWFEKVVRLATPADITHVWVDGRLVAGAVTR